MTKKMKYLIIILISSLSVSCMTVNKVKRNCDLFMTVCEVPVKKEVEIITNIVTEVIYRDTIIYVKVPGKTVIKEVPVYIVEGIVNSELSALNVPFAKSTARVIGSRLEHKLTQTDTLYRVKLENVIRYSKTLEKQNKVLKEKYVVTVKENSPLAVFSIKWFFGSLILIILVFIWKFKSKILSLFQVR